ncbi:RNase H family protein [Streptomyces sp. TRM 70361]|uniref:RNase H family protein n=1 Tax=Streptomyces sp. TRM 70361 TaxID=3116553 RepID=UPI002E7C4DE0|nr:RNase H family protein [Streptomyces sp. TRM 70361]MEE1941961.1 RNase H family protein [Streptomyces sp. TRM 70361]
MTITEHTELIRRFVDDFTALQEAVLARMNGICAPEITVALEHTSLAGPITVVLAHADVLARGAVRHAELSGRPPERLRRLRAHARRVRRARSQAEALYKERRARRLAGLTRPVDALELRVVRRVSPVAFAEALRQELRDRGLPDGTPQAPESDLARWAWDRKTAGGEPPTPVRELRDCDDDAFVQALLCDAREEENPHLPHDAVAERWSRHARTALAWGRYAIGRAERDVLACSPSVRRTRLDALDDAYQDTAVLAARSREARLRVTDLHDRMRTCMTAGPLAELIAQCRAAALARFADTEPEVWHSVRELIARHRAHCPEQADGCPRCHRTLAAAFADARHADPDEDGDGEHPTATATPTATAPADGDRYALLADLPDTAVVAVADAAVGEESALCGYGWAAEDGTTGHGDSLASSSGEAEVIGICAAALSLLEHHEETPVVLLCDSTEAVDAVDAALRSADPAAAHRTLLFPESRRLLDRLLRHCHRVQVRWLKGHIGHDLNETADAFARFALRRANGRIPPSAARKEEARILRSLGSGTGPLSVAA